MNKKINFAIASVLSLWLFVSALTATPSQISPDHPNETIVAELKPLQTPNADTIATVSATSTATGPAQTSILDSNALPAHPRPQFQSSVSRGTVNQKPSAPSISQATAIVSTAKRYLGVKYVWGGTTPNGFDCSGFTQYVFDQQGISLPRVSSDQYNTGSSVSLSNLQPGDLIFFSLGTDKGIDHVGIYTGDGQFINASTSKGVTIYTLGAYWKSHFAGAKRVL